MRSIAALALAGALLVGCGDDDDDTAADDTTTSTTTAEETTTTVADDTTTTAAEASTTTAVPAATTTAAAAGAELVTSDPDVAAVAEAFTTVFDSSVPVADKEPYLPEFATLEPVLEQFGTAADALGGVTVDISDVTVDGDTATAAFDVLAGGAVYAPDFTGDAIRTESGWGLSLEYVCTFLGYAQISCPA
jgi:hypothetical protein